MIDVPPPEPLLGTPRLDPEWERHVMEVVHLLGSDPMEMLRASIARRSGIPMSEVVERWSDLDLAVELAVEILEERDRAERCPNCGSHPKDYLNARGREMAHGRLKVEVRSCRMCAHIHAAHSNLGDDAAKNGRYVTLAHRGVDDDGNPEPLTNA